ncbi:MAG: MarR family winged helix-turn-helix transcriptional regulator [Spirochaetota bacterium]
MPKNAEAEDAPRVIDYVFTLKKLCAVEEAAIVEELGLNASEIHCLETIDPEHPLGTGLLSRFMRLSPSRGGRIVERLIERGLLERKPYPYDRRYSMVHLTERGREVRERVEQMKRRCEERITGCMTEEHIGLVRRGLELLIHAMDPEEAYHVREA